MTLISQTSRRRLRHPLLRLAYLRLIIPLKRGWHEPEVMARSVGLGLLYGFTPTVGIQTQMVLATWLVAKPLKWRFDPLVAIVWTLVSNPFTMVPLYYLFYLVGLALTGDANHFTDFASFEMAFNALLAESATSGFWDGTAAVVGFLWDTMGVNILMGCLPFSLISAPLGYYAVLFSLRRRAARLRNPAIVAGSQ
ncbi:MAG: DUF2062 domain-containing protein [Magnetococcus sp. WYHC-3]